jgi:hypothetical protein
MTFELSGYEKLQDKGWLIRAGRPVCIEFDQQVASKLILCNISGAGPAEGDTLPSVVITNITKRVRALPAEVVRTHTVCNAFKQVFVRNLFPQIGFSMLIRLASRSCIHPPFDPPVPLLMNGVKENLNSESFKSSLSLARAFQSVGLVSDHLHHSSR